jgi:hypothetical protein
VYRLKALSRAAVRPETSGEHAWRPNFRQRRRRHVSEKPTVDDAFAEHQPAYSGPPRTLNQVVGGGSPVLSGPINAGAPVYPGSNEYLKRYGFGGGFNYFPVAA